MRFINRRSVACAGNMRKFGVSASWLRAGASHFSFASLIVVVSIRQNQLFRRWRRHLALFAAHVLGYAARKKRQIPCQHRKILVFRILPTPAIRLRFAPAEKRWLASFCPSLGLSNTEAWLDVTLFRLMAGHPGREALHEGSAGWTRGWFSKPSDFSSVLYPCKLIVYY